MTLGVATSGFMIAVLWVLWHAPDLALTQTIVETVSVVPLFLAFAYLPKLRQSSLGPRVDGVNAVVGCGFGREARVISHGPCQPAVCVHR